MTQKRFIFILILNLISILLFTNSVFAYGVETHAGITKEIFKYYNQEFSSNQIPEEYKNFLIEGSRREDIPPRWMHHFYDPVNNIGLQDPILGYWTSSKEWSQDSKEQNKPIYKVATGIASLLSGQQEIKINWKETNFTWQQAIRFYVNNEKEKAFYALGHVLHLIEDASVPDHTRNDPHPALDSEDHLGTGSPYELWTHKFTPEIINLSDDLIGKKSINLDSLNAYFDSMANYSNNNFYSKDTVGTSTYSNPIPDHFKKENGIYYGIKIQDNKEYHLIAEAHDDGLVNVKTKKKLQLIDGDGERVLNDYWRLLSTKAAQHGAGVINLFFQEVEKAKNDPDYLKEEKSLLGKVVDSVKKLRGQLISAVSKEDNFEVVETINLAEESGSNKITKAENISKIEITENKSSEEIIEEKIILPPEKKAEPETQEEINKTEEVKNQTENKIISACSFNTNQKPSNRNVVINEVAWMGSVNSANDEWFELKNISNDIVDISGWRIFDKDEQVNITIQKITKLYPQAIYLLERGGGNSVPNIAADYIYESAGNGAPSLKNSDEGLRLFDANCNLIDEVLASPSWPAGDNSSKATMERRIDLSWQTSSFAGGTPRQENLSGSVSGGNSYPVILISGGSSSESENKQVELPKIIITEIMYDLSGSDTGREWIEVFNKGDKSADLSSLKLFENDTNHSLRAVNGDTNLPAGGYAVVADNADKFLEDWPDYNGALFDSAFSLKNDGETVSIKSGDDKLDEVGYFSDWGAAGNGNSLQLINGEWKESAPTPGSENKISAAAINQAPSAFFVSEPAIAYIGEEIAFDASFSTDSDGQIVLFEWNFGDGSQEGGAANFINHLFSTGGNFEVVLNITDDTGATSTFSENILIKSKQSNHVVISEIQVGTDNGVEDEFIELYNPTDEEVDLTGWEIRKRTSGETESNLVDDGKFTGTIKPKSFYLIAHPGYQGARQPDLFYSASSTNLAYSDNAVVLYNGDHSEAEIIDEVSYASIGKNQSLERKAYAENGCIVAQGEGEFLGNACDTDSIEDFDTRVNPGPQNSDNLLEPRNPPTASELNAVFDAATMKISLSWSESFDFRGSSSTIAYKLLESSNEENIIYSGQQTNFSISISEVGRAYDFSLQAIDEEGLSSEIVSRQVFVPSFFEELNFFIKEPEDASSSPQYSLNANLNKYPFIPIIFKHTQSGQYSPNNWHTVIFYYNQPAKKTSDLLWTYFNQEDPQYNLWGLRNVPDGLKIIYPNCAGSATTGYSLILADKESLCVPSGYYRNYTLKFDQLAGNKMTIGVSGENFASSSPAVEQDYITAAFYAYRPGAEPNNYILGFLATDKTKYYLKTAP